MAMNRRDAIKSFALMMGGAMVGANVILTGCSPEDQIVGLEFTPDQIAFLDEIGEAIIPTTDTPGAKAAGIGEFMVMMVKDTYNGDQQTVFISGLNQLRKDFKDANGKDFMNASTDERTAFLNEMNKKAKESENGDPKVIGMLKDLTVLGYFTSEIGATQQLRFVEAPGRYDGCMDYKKGDRVFAL
ncbi:gluconate 2-dehydrogenase subunit 3 family protein [Belliella kenyensis]|uniref:Gluconate 2-dehydrogenase subunit 3 family protein n=1 Tax=Belliella kenyensis TaxID=1472724 RepID=A0ABV8EKR9_9BACT|nr:gluconate 2-dehydrogenase subunit 3 family protein [Belliella kenyensis]MCH7403144.1 gluconate 2-dehydrogenase subunit 3 family protein [Belliella kenyensis]MDN3602313.1 gluconate 2-dehydrogenase subunit 3 family protein [Belliella kenyensis]